MIYYIVPPGFQLSRSPMHAPSSTWTRCYIGSWGARHLPCIQVHDDDDEAGGDVDDDGDQVGVPQQC